MLEVGTFGDAADVITSAGDVLAVIGAVPAAKPGVPAAKTDVPACEFVMSMSCRTTSPQEIPSC